MAHAVLRVSSRTADVTCRHPQRDADAPDPTILTAACRSTKPAAAAAHSRCIPSRHLRCAATSKQGANNAHPALLKAIETALGAVSKVLQETEKKRKSRLQSGAVEVEPVAAKLIAFQAGSSNERTIKAPHLPGRTLATYLALPLESYSLLDPRWISRTPEDPNLFQLSIPLQELVGLALQPCISIRVDVDPAHGQVHFHASRFSLGVPKFDQDFKLDMKAKLQHRPVPQAFTLPSFGFWRRGPQEDKAGSSQEPAASEASSSSPVLRALDAPVTSVLAASVVDAPVIRQAPEPSMPAPTVPLMEATSTVAPEAAQSPAGRADSSATTGSASEQQEFSSSSSGSEEEQQEGGSSSSGSQETSSAVLWCSVNVEIEALAPHPLSVVPRPLLNLTASLITKFTIIQLLPAFLQLLSIDYERWALGKVQARTQSAGSLLSLVGPRGGSASMGHNIIASSSSTQGPEGRAADGSAGDQGAAMTSASFEEPVCIAVPGLGGEGSSGGSSGSEGSSSEGSESEKAVSSRREAVLSQL